MSRQHRSPELDIPAALRVLRLSLERQTHLKARQMADSMRVLAFIEGELAGADAKRQHEMIGALQMVCAAFSGMVISSQHKGEPEVCESCAGHMVDQFAETLIRGYHGFQALGAEAQING